MTSGEPQVHPPSHGALEEPERRLPTLLDWASLVLGAAWRRRVLVLAVFLFGVGASITYYFAKTPVYRVEAKILAQRQQALPSVMRPSAPDESPTRSAWELIHRRENLMALAKETNLLAEASPKRVRSILPASSSDAASQANDDRLDKLVIQLDRALVVTTGDGTVNISIDWPDASQAYHLVESALQNFLETRHLQEVTTIDETISLLQERAEALREQLAKAVEETRREARYGADIARYLATPRAQRTSRSQSQEGGEQELVRLKSRLDAKERAIRDVEEFRRRRLVDLQTQLDEKRGVYSDAHPSIIALRKDIDALSRESPQIMALREEEKQLRQEYSARLGQEGRPVPASTPAPSTPIEPRPSRQGDGTESERVRDARFRYERMVERVNAAQLELDAARAAFKYRYNVIWPPQMPKKPVSPSPIKAFALGPFASLVLALLAAAAADLRTGRVVDRWQVERVLDLPVLAELSRK